ncbi:MAG: glycosyl hydrolase family 28-related protein [Ectobacillus sp.]
MLHLDKKHDPRKNALLLSQLSEYKQDMKTALKETEYLFRRYSTNENAPRPKQRRPFSTLAFLKSFPFLLFKPPAKHTPAPARTYVDMNGNAYPEWKKQLDEQYIQLMKNIKKEVNVEDYGAVGDGVTDNTKAFQKAIGNGRVKVRVPKGVFVTKRIKLPSWTCLIGEGKGVTIIKLHDDAPKEARLITNANHIRGNRNIFVQGMSLNWNVSRLNDTEKTGAGNNRSSCLTFANVSFGWVKDMEGINAGLHCFDVSSTVYDYSGDGTVAPGRSRFIWLDNLNGYGFGDDGITTHHSDNILISNCHMCDPSGRAHDKGFSNSNGIEIDDGSRNVWLVNNSTARCFGGVEIKAHHNASAASNVQIIGHISVNDNRSYNFRHIGHHKSTDPESKTAYHIKATNIVAIAPIYTELYTNSTPRGMVVSAYKNIVINGFTLLGDPNYNYEKNPVIALQYRARNIVLNRVTIRSFKTAGADIKVFGGDQRADAVHIRNVRIRNSAPQAIDIGTGLQNFTIHNIRARSEGGSCCLKTGSVPASISEIHTKGYNIPILITENTCDELPFHVHK